MKRSYAILFVAMVFTGCSMSTSQTPVQTPHVHDPVNSIRPGNAIGNSLEVPEPFQGFGEDSRRATLPSSHGSNESTDWLAHAAPFSSMSDGDAQPQQTSATPEQILGLEANSYETSPSSAPSLPSAPSAVFEPSSPTWSEIASTSDPVEPRSQMNTEQVYRAAEALPGLESWTVVPFAHFQRELRHVVVAWPAVNSNGAVVDATVVGICLEENESGELESCGSRWVVNDRAASRAALERALGGSDYEVISAQVGAPLDELGPRLSELATSFTNALDDGDRAGARRAAAEFAQMLPAEQIAFDNELAQLLWAAAHYDGRLEHVGTEQGDQLATLTFDVNRGWARLRTIRVIAQTAAGDPNQWIVVDYR